MSAYLFDDYRGVRIAEGPSTRRADYTGPLVDQVANRLRISSTNREIIAYVRSRLSPAGLAPENREARHEILRGAIARVHANRNWDGSLIDCPCHVCDPIGAAA